MYLQAAQEVSRRHELEGLLPGRSDAGLLWVDLHRVDPPLEEQQHAVHDAHDEVRRAAKRPYSGDVRWLDRLNGYGGDKNKVLRQRRKNCVPHFILCLKTHGRSIIFTLFTPRSEPRYFKSDEQIKGSS